HTFSNFHVNVMFNCRLILLIIKSMFREIIVEPSKWVWRFTYQIRGFIIAFTIMVELARMGACQLPYAAIMYPGIGRPTEFLTVQMVCTFPLIKPLPLCSARHLGSDANSSEPLARPPLGPLLFGDRGSWKDLNAQASNFAGLSDELLLQSSAMQELIYVVSCSDLKYAQNIVDLLESIHNVDDTLRKKISRLDTSLRGQYELTKVFDKGIARELEEILQTFAPSWWGSMADHFGYYLQAWIPASGINQHARPSRLTERVYKMVAWHVASRYDQHTTFWELVKEINEILDHQHSSLEKIRQIVMQEARTAHDTKRELETEIATGHSSILSSLLYLILSNPRHPDHHMHLIKERVFLLDRIQLRYQASSIVIKGVATGLNETDNQQKAMMSQIRHLREANRKLLVSGDGRSAGEVNRVKDGDREQDIHVQTDKDQGDRSGHGHDMPEYDQIETFHNINFDRVTLHDVQLALKASRAQADLVEE
ncbi:MAG: hypothetical protein Q9164_007614, partial [Protoblastenia rupestris]